MGRENEALPALVSVKCGRALSKLPAWGDGGKILGATVALPPGALFSLGDRRSPPTSVKACSGRRAPAVAPPAPVTGLTEGSRHLRFYHKDAEGPSPEGKDDGGVSGL